MENKWHLIDLASSVARAGRSVSGPCPLAWFRTFKKDRTMKRDAIVIKEEDNVATALRDLHCNDLVSVGIGDKTIAVTLVESVAFGHKFAVLDILKGQDIIKYGEVIGRATADISAGAHAHIQNIESLRGRGDLA